MDPNQVLIDLRDLAQDIREGTGEYDLVDTAETMSAGFEALDTWLTRGGSLPSDWER